MLAARVTCPSCGQSLIVAENAPPRVTCPRCLAQLVNPASPQSGVPRPVIPLDRQAERDMGRSKWLTVGLLASLAVGAVITYSVSDVVGFRFVLLATLALTVCQIVLGGFRRAMRTASPELASASPAAAPAPVNLPESPRQPIVLDYGAPRRLRRAPATVGAFAGGFFSAIGVCALGFVILGSTADMSSRRSGANHNALFLVGVVVMVVAFMVASIRVSGRWPGFGPGATTGLILGLMALGPCAACYLLTLGG